MADSFFGFDTSLSNLNDDEGGGEPSEDEYDALNDETFGQADEFDWEVEHEQLAEQLESSRRHNSGIDDLANTELEASLSQLVLDETDAPHSRSFGSSVWRHDPPAFPVAPTPVPGLKNVCTVEELERQLRQKQQQQTFTNQNYFQPRFPPVILQRPPGLQAPVPLPFAPQQTMNHGLNQGINQMNQPLNKLMNQMGQSNQLMQNHVNHTPFMQNNQFQNNIGPGNMINQLSQSMHMGQNNILGQNLNMQSQNMNMQGQNLNMQSQNLNMSMQNSNLNHIGPNVNQIGRSIDQINHNINAIGRNIDQLNQMNQGVNQIGQNVNQMGQNVNQLGQNVNQMGQNVNQMNQINQNMNQMGQNVNQMIPNGNQFPPGINQFQHMMGQGPRMIAPPPGMNMPRQNFNPNMGQFNANFRAPSMPSKEPINPPISQPLTQSNMLINQQMIMKPLNNIKSNTQINSIQKPIQKLQTPPKDTKVQKSRVYNNSKQNLTSQNLVQIIQNTHPMLQFNNIGSFHNANHHPMLNNNRNIFTNSQFNHPMFNQRHNGTFNNRHMNGDEGPGSDDEYAGLMTPREKQWLVNIQMLQLNTGTPYIHDFYYTVFLERQASKEKEGIKEAHKANQQNHPFYSGGVKQESHQGRERHNSNRHNSTSEDSGTPRTYVPAQFENSLGKLQCGSVTAPRKIIDVEVVGTDAAPGRLSRASSVASTTHPHEVPREMKRTKQLLLDIEALYLILLRLEELNDPLAISNALILKEREEKQKQLEAAQKEAESEQQDVSNLFLKNIESVQRRPKQDSPKSESIDKRQVVNLAVNQKPAPIKNLLDEDKDDLLNKMFAGLLHSDRVQQMITVRKGKTLISRFVSRVCPTHARLRSLWARVLRALAPAARRDDGSLAQLAPHYRSYIQNTTGWSPILESCSMLSEAFDPARTPYALTTSFTLSCVCALIEKAAILVNTPDATSNERQWSKFLKTLARALKNTSLNVARPLQPMPEAKLMQHIKQLESRSTIEILQRGKAQEFADLTKNDVSEQLVKHLC
ncbi:protein associated with topo II related - 1 isoform X2 [Anticarsia gemmatalis]|uniref:protein associated with topo II related - 1 isoform X2 n=1 Tax=Anticarsia gemmatalis TaxID=129554 RepID=UPI003F759D9B